MLRKRGTTSLAQKTGNERRLAKVPTSIFEYEEFKLKDIKIEKNAEIIKENLRKIITESIEHNLNTIILACGHILAPYQNLNTDDLQVPGDVTMVQKSLANKIRFLSLLNFRRILNTIQGINEEFLDNLVVFKREYPILDFENGVDTKSLLNAGMQYDFFEKVIVTPKQFEFMKDNTLSGFIGYMDKTNSDLFLTDFQSDNKLRDNIRKRRLADGVILQQDMEYQLKSKDSEIKMLKVNFFISIFFIFI